MITGGIIASVCLIVAAYFIGFWRGQRSYIRSMFRAVIKANTDANVYGTGVMEFGRDEVRHVPFSEIHR